MRHILVFLFLSVMSLPVSAGEYRLGDLSIKQPIARETPSGAKVAAGYLMIQNGGAEADRLLGGNAEFATEVEIHEVKMNADVMKMHELEKGLEIAPAQMVMLKPGGYHIMFQGLKERLTKGQKREVELVFEKAGKIKVTFDVQSIAETMKLKHNH